MRTLVSALILVVVSISVLSTVAGAYTRPAVYLDQSREFLFRMSWDLARMLRDRYLVTVGERVLTSERLAQYDVIILPTSRIVGYTSEEMFCIKKFLNAGGGVLLLDSGRGLSESVTSLLTYLQVPVRSSGIAGIGELVDQEGQPLGITVTGKTMNILGPGFVAKVTDGNDRPVLVEGTVGKGQLAVAGDEGILLTNDFSQLSSEAFKLVDRLVVNRTGGDTGIVEERLLPEHTLQHGDITLYYSDVLKDYVDLIIEHADEVFDFIGGLHGHNLPEGLRVVLLACWGSGYSAHGEIGVGVLGEVANVIDVLGHELTHEWVWPAKMPPSIEEGWCSLAGARLSEQLGFTEYAERQRTSFANAYSQTKRELEHLDLGTGHETKGVHWSGHMGKTMHLVEEAEEIYGPGFTRDFFTLARQLISKGEASSPLTLEDIAIVVGAILSIDQKVIYDRLRGGNYLDIISPRDGEYLRGKVSIVVQVPSQTADVIEVSLGDYQVYEGIPAKEPIVLDTTMFDDGEYVLTVELFTDGVLKKSHSVEVFLDNWQRTEDHLRAPQESPWFGTIKRSNYLECSSGWRHDTGNRAEFFDDDDRLLCTGVDVEYVVYEAVDVRDFAITLYTKRPQPEGIAVEVSADMIHWIPLHFTEQVYGTGLDWCKIILKGQEFESTGTSYLRIIVDGRVISHGEVALGKIEYTSRVRTVRN
ncbi:MAG: hypothetical protein M0Q40_09120 [Limnochordia bacterium]|nr:hypothetical protein [Limnochordia bacterium]